MFTLDCAYELGGQPMTRTTLDNDDYTFALDVADDHIKGVLTAKKNLVMRKLVLDSVRKFDSDDLFLANGYQSWTTTREFRRNETLPGVMKIAVGDFLRPRVGISGDYEWATYDVQGRFHSYTFTYFRKAGDQTIELYGSRTERQGYTIFDVDMLNNRFSLVKDIDGLELAPGQEYVVFDLCVIKDTYDAAFDQYFFDFMGLKKPRVDRLAGYTSWYNYFQNITEDIILRDLDGLDRAQELTQIYQIDDGYESYVGDWETPDPKKFPNGMKICADKIHEKGYLAGLWLAPFCAQIKSRTAKEHPDWMVTYNKNGKKRLAHFGWGGAYALDFYNPEVRAYIKQFFNTVLNDWGFDMVKLDFLYCVAQEPRMGKTRGQIMTEGCEFLRECCGDKIILGCGAPLGAGFGYFDACRVGCDAHKNYNGDIWNKVGVNEELPSARNAILDSVFRRCLNGRAFANDPDVFFLRDKNVGYSLPQKLLLAKVNDIVGSILFVSDNVGDYNEATLDYLKYFFEDKKITVQSVEPLDSDRLAIRYTEKGQPKTLNLNLKSGYSNVVECME